MKIDKITLQILANYSRAAAESMAYTLFRTAYSTFVKETQDFTTLLATPSGKTFAYSLDIGATWFTGVDIGNVINMIPDYQEGDICMTNDPYSGFVCSHTPDITLWMPVFYEEKLVCFAAGHVHHTDVGGAVPASLSRALKEIFQEGIRIPPMKLFHAGVLNQNAIDILLTNVRVPKQSWGDMKAHIAAIKTGERKVKEMVKKFGMETFQNGIEDLLEYTEEQTRSIIRKIPDGEYFFSDYIDEDGVSKAPCRLAVNMIIKGDEMVLDFSKSDTQLASSFNIPTGGFERHYLVLINMYLAFHTLDPNLNLNAGVNSPIRCILPEGSVVNPKFPAAVGMRTLSCLRMQDVLAGCLSQAIPKKMPACHSGSCSLMAVSTIDDKTGNPMVATIEPILGGAGATPTHDGPNGAGGNMGFLENTPVEMNEAEMPLQILKYELVPDSGGAGKYRGGLATILEFKVFSPNDTITARNRDRVKFRPWGVLGGKAGKPSWFTINKGKENELDLGDIDFSTLNPGDVVSIVSSGGGGWGSPLERKPEKVVTDVRRGFVSEEAAKIEYGVVMKDGDFGPEATERERARLREEEKKSLFDFGPERVEYESIWNEQVYEALIEVLYRVPTTWRSFLKTKMFEAIEHYRGVQEIQVSDIYDTFGKMKKQFSFPELAGYDQ